MSEEKEKILYVNHKTELLIWLIILLIPSIIFFFTHISKSDSDDEYNIFMPDVDGLIVGSPVRAMGIEIGHVIKIEPVKDEVLVRFIINDKTIELPRGTQATVEFSGMAGSKSLELYLPDKSTYVDSTVPTLTVSSPKRLSDAAGLLNEMFKHIGNIITVSSKFGSKLSEIDFPESKGDPRDFLKFADEIIDIQQQRVDAMGDKLNELQQKQFNRNIKSYSKSESLHD